MVAAGAAAAANRAPQGLGQVGTAMLTAFMMIVGTHFQNLPLIWVKLQTAGRLDVSNAMLVFGTLLVCSIAALLVYRLYKLIVDGGHILQFFSTQVLTMVTIPILMILAMGMVLHYLEIDRLAAFTSYMVVGFLMAVVISQLAHECISDDWPVAQTSPKLASIVAIGLAGYNKDPIAPLERVMLYALVSGAIIGVLVELRITRTD